MLNMLVLVAAEILMPVVDDLERRDLESSSIRSSILNKRCQYTSCLRGIAWEYWESSAPLHLNRWY